MNPRARLLFVAAHGFPSTAFVQPRSTLRRLCGQRERRLSGGREERGENRCKRSRGGKPRSLTPTGVPRQPFHPLPSHTRTCPRYALSMDEQWQSRQPHMKRASAAGARRPQLRFSPPTSEAFMHGHAWSLGQPIHGSCSSLSALPFYHSSLLSASVLLPHQDHLVEMTRPQTTAGTAADNRTAHPSWSSSSTSLSSLSFSPRSTAAEGLWSPPTTAGGFTALPSLGTFSLGASASNAFSSLWAPSLPSLSFQPVGLPFYSGPNLFLHRDLPNENGRRSVNRKGRRLCASTRTAELPSTRIVAKRGELRDPQPGVGPRHSG